MLCNNEEAEDLNSQLEALKLELANEKQKSLKLQQELVNEKQKSINLEQELSLLRQKIIDPKTSQFSHNKLSRNFVRNLFRKFKRNGSWANFDDDSINLLLDDDEENICEEENVVEHENSEKYKVVSQLNSWTNLQKITENAIIRDVKSGVIETQDDIKSQVKKIDEKLIVDAENMGKPEQTQTSPEASKIVFNKTSLKSMVEEWDIVISTRDAGKTEIFTTNGKLLIGFNNNY